MSIKGKIILIIDDDPSIIRLLTKIFEILGVSILSAQNLSEAKKILYQTIPHLIILDIVLGDENGLDYINFLTSLPYCKSIPVIILSGINDKKTLSNVKKHDPIDIISKPIVASLLIQKVRKYLKEHDSKQIIFDNFHETPQLFTTEGSIKKINPYFVEVESHVKISNETYLKLKSILFKKIDFPDAKFIGGNYVKKTQDGIFLNKLYHVGANDAVIKNILALKNKK